MSDPVFAPIFAVVGPSGAGKDTLIREACAMDPGLVWVRRSITRPPAPTEPFESLDPLEFAAAKAAGEFALHWEAHGLRYGIRPAEMIPPPGGALVFNGSRAALPNARIKFPQLRAIVITAPAAVLARRLAERGRESEEEIAARLARAGFDLPRGLDHAILSNDGTPQEGARRLLSLMGRAPADLSARA